MAVNNNGDYEEKLKKHVRSFSCNVESLAALMSPGGTKHVHNNNNNKFIFYIALFPFSVQSASHNNTMKFTDKNIIIDFKSRI